MANAGADTTADVGDKVSLVGTASSDPDGEKLTYQWTIVSRPAGSAAALAKAATSKASIVLDRAGAYVVRLVVRDSVQFSAPDDLTITTTNTTPAASAGPDRQVAAGTLVQLSGAGSSDLDGDALTFAWTLKKPKGSGASLAGASTIAPSFTADIAGNYTATLNVSDGMVTKKDTVVVTTANNVAPVVRAGRDEVALEAGQQIQLDGQNTTDANGQLLGFAWSITKKPGASSAPLAGATTPRPTFTADVKGKYTFSLTVTDPGTLSGNDLTIYTAAFPVSDAGPDQLATVGSPVTLDGSGSSHLNGTLTYGWSLLSAPAGSTAAFDDPADPQPTFEPDLEGTYLAQLVVFDGTNLSPGDTVVVTTNGNLAPRIAFDGDRMVGSRCRRDDRRPGQRRQPRSADVQLGPHRAARRKRRRAVERHGHADPDHARRRGRLPRAVDGARPRRDGHDRHAAADDRQHRPDRGCGSGPNRSPAARRCSSTLAANDPDGGALTYAWSILAQPAGSDADLSDPTDQEPTFTPDGDGVYVVQAVVRDSRRLLAVDTTVLRVGAGGGGADGGCGPGADRASRRARDAERHRLERSGKPAGDLRVDLRVEAGRQHGRVQQSDVQPADLHGGSPGRLHDRAGGQRRHAGQRARARW